MLNTSTRLLLFAVVCGFGSSCEDDGPDEGGGTDSSAAPTTTTAGGSDAGGTTSSEGTDSDTAASESSTASTSTTGAASCLPASPSALNLRTEVAPLRGGAFSATVESSCEVSSQTAARAELMCDDGLEVVIREHLGEVLNLGMLPSPVEIELFHLAPAVSSSATELVIRDGSGALLLAYKDTSADNLVPGWGDRLQPVSVSLSDSDCDQEVPLYCASCTSRTATFAVDGTETPLLNGQEAVLTEGLTAIVTRNISCERERECDAGEIQTLNLALVHSSLL